MENQTQAEAGRTFLSATQILAHKGKRKTEEVHVPGWGGWVRVSSMPSARRDEFEQQMLEEKKDPETGKTRHVQNLSNFRAKLAAATLVDEAGNPLFTEAQVRELGQLDAADMDRVFSVAQRLNGFTASDIEELAGNSENVPGDDSSSI